MKHGLFSTQLELEPNQSPAHKQPWKLEMLGSSSKMVPKWQDFIKPKHWVWSDTPHFGKAWTDMTFSPWINHFLGCTGCEILYFHPWKKGCRGVRGRYSAPFGDKGLCLNKLPLCYPHTHKYNLLIWGRKLVHYIHENLRLLCLVVSLAPGLYPGVPPNCEVCAWMGASDRRVCLSHQNWKERKKERSASIHYSSLLPSIHRNFGSFVGQNGST